MAFSSSGLDRSLPHIGIIMEKYDTGIYPRYSLPEGFHFSPFEEGFQHKWAELQLSVEMVDSIEEAEDYFYEDFLLGVGHNWLQPQSSVDKSREVTEYPCYDKMRRRIVFILDSDGVLAGTGSLWHGDIFGKEYQRLHWIAVKPGYQGLGLAKAILTRLLDMYNTLGYKGYIYLTSQTWSYKALNIYGKFGFKPYKGEKPEKWVSVNLTSGKFEPWDYTAKNIEAWELINRKISQYNTER